MYTGDSKLKGKGVASARSIDAWVQRNGQRVMERNGVTGWTIPKVGAYYIELGKQTGLNHDLMVAQACKECAYFTSDIFRAKLNPAGIGAINAAPMEGAITFETVFDGIRCQYAHMLSYVEGEGHMLITYSPRHEILRTIRNDRSGPNGYLGIVSKLTDLNQRWAWSPPEIYNATPNHLRYGQSTSTWANQLIAFHHEYDTGNDDDIDEGEGIMDIELPYHKDIGKRFKEDGPFADYWRMLASRIGHTEALMIIGFPITDEFKVDGITMQYTERARLEHHPGAFPEHHDVLLGHLGREDVRLQEESKERLERIEKIEKLLKKLR